MDKKHIKYGAVFLSVVMLFPLMAALPASAEGASDETGVKYNLSEVVNYEEKTVYDESIIGLYHLNGSKENAMPNSSVAALTGIGSYITGHFENGLYTKGPQAATSSKYTVTIPLPSDIGTGDFTLEFWMYVTANNLDITTLQPFVTIGGKKALQQSFKYNATNKIESRNYYIASGKTAGTVPVNTWHNVCIQREDGILYYYRDGAKRSFTLDFAYDLTGSIQIVGMAGTQTCSARIDEIRFSRGARYGDSFTPAESEFECTKIVKVAPETGEPGTIAIQSDIPVGELHVGESLPSGVGHGDVAVLVSEREGQFNVQSMVQYQNGGWVSVDGSIYDKGGWNNATSYNVTEYVYVPPPPEPEPESSSSVSQSEDSSSSTPEDSSSSQPDDSSTPPIVVPGGDGGQVVPESRGPIGIFLDVLSLIYSLFRFEMNVYGFVFSFWDVMMFGLLVGVVIKFVGYVFYED